MRRCKSELLFLFTFRGPFSTDAVVFALSIAAMDSFDGCVSNHTFTIVITTPVSNYHFIFHALRVAFTVLLALTILAFARLRSVSPVCVRAVYLCSSQMEIVAFRLHNELNE